MRSTQLRPLALSDLSDSHAASASPHSPPASPPLSPHSPSQREGRLRFKLEAPVPETNRADRAGDLSSWLPQRDETEEDYRQSLKEALQKRFASRASSGCIALLADAMTITRYEVCEVVLQQDAPNESVFVVLRGCINIILDDLFVGEIHKHGFWGEAALFGLQGGSNRMLNTTAVAVVAELSQEKFKLTLQAAVREGIQHDFQPIMTDIQRVDMNSMTYGTSSRTCELFDGLSMETLLALNSASLLQVRYPGSAIRDAGDLNNQLHIVVHGSVSVQKDDRDRSEQEALAANLPLCFGEMLFLGLGNGPWEALAKSTCLVRVVPRAVLLKALEDHNDALLPEQIDRVVARSKGIAGSLGAEDKVRVLRNIRIFQEVDCSSNFMHFLAQHLEAKIYHKGDMVVDEKGVDRCMHLLRRGQVEVTKEGKVLAQFSGDMDAPKVIGELVLLGLVEKRSASVRAMEHCHTWCLHQSTVTTGTHLFPDDRNKVLKMAMNRTEKGAALEGPLRDNRAFIQEIRRSPFFDGMSDSFIERLGNSGVDRIFMPGERIIGKGQPGNSMYILVHGAAFVMLTSTSELRGLDKKAEASKLRRVSVLIEDSQTIMPQVQSMRSGAVFGELAMLGVGKIRSATIIAQTLCFLWEITQDAAMSVLDDFPLAQKKFTAVINNHLEESVQRRFQKFPLFHHFDPCFGLCLTLQSERRVYFPGTRAQPDGLWVVNMGQLASYYDGVKVCTHPTGEYIGATVMLGTAKWIATVSVAEVSHIIVVTKESYQTALEKYPAAAADKALRENTMREVTALEAAFRKVAKSVTASLREEENRGANSDVQSEPLRFMRHGQGKAEGAVSAKHLRKRIAHSVERWTTKQREAVGLRMQKDRTACQGALLRHEARQDPNAQWDSSIAPAAISPERNPSKCWHLEPPVEPFLAPLPNLGPYMVDQASPRWPTSARHRNRSNSRRPPGGYAESTAALPPISQRRKQPCHIDLLIPPVSVAAISG
mmetsp:Transcript_22788/g.52065  ORF Transcript_22788/g.52065 Transcript_22788/m.52065 type:complete len:994 (+) Transcript_22788:165-3146(+)